MDLIPFEYQGQQVRTAIRDGEPWFAAPDACRVLDIGNPTMAVSRLDEDERTLITVEGASNGLPINFVSEAGLYALVLTSRKPEAKAFRRWITHEVIPSIRKDGMYATDALLDDPEHLLRVTQRLVEERQARLVAETKVQELAPKAEFHDKVAGAVDTQSIGEVAKVLGSGQNRMFAWLRGQRILMSNNVPFQEYVEAGYFRLKEQTWEDRDGNVHLTTKTLVTGKGLTWLQKRFHDAQTGRLAAATTREERLLS